MGELSQAEMIERGDDYFEIADAIHPFGDARLRAVADVLREAARHLLRANEVGYRDMAGKVEECRRCFRDLSESLQRGLRAYVGREVWLLIGRHLAAETPRAGAQTTRRAPISKASGGSGQGISRAAKRPHSLARAFTL
jgi:hypothetical protein